MSSLFKRGSGYFNSVKWGSYAIAISLFRQLCLVPVFIIAIGDVGYSFWILLSTLVTLLTALNLGHLHYSSNLININYHINGNADDEVERIQGANYIYIIVQLAIGLLFCTTPVLSFITSFSQSYIQEHHAGLSFFLLLTGRIFYQYSGSFILRLLEPLGRIDTALKYQAIGELIDFVTILAAVFFTRSIFFTCVAACISNIVFSAAIVVFVSKNVPFKIAVRKLNLKKSYRFIKSSFSLNSSFLIERAYDTGLNLIVVRVFGTSILPVFTTSRILTNIFYRVCWVLVIPLFPDIQKKFALKEYGYIVDRIKIFWSILSILIVFGVTVSLPFLPYIYSLWTHNKLGFNLYIVSFLFMAVSFQNFGMIINEFFKKTNFSKQILVLNTIKSVVTIVAIVVFGWLMYTPGMGLALVIGELLCLVYSMQVLTGIFKGNISWPVVGTYIMPIFLFCVSLLFYLWQLNYWAFAIFNSMIIIYCVYKNNNFKGLKEILKH